MLRLSVSCLLLLAAVTASGALSRARLGALSSGRPAALSACKAMDVVQTWELGYSMNVNLTFPVDTQTWNATLEFDTELANLEMWSDQLETTDNRVYTVHNTMWDGGHRAGDVVTLFFVVDFRSRYDPAQLTSVKLLGNELC